MHLTDLDQQAIKLMARWYSDGAQYATGVTIRDKLKVEAPAYREMMAVLEGLGIIEEISTDGEELETVNINRRVVLESRKLDRAIEERRIAPSPDAVEDSLRRLKGQRWLAPVVIGVIVLTTLVTLINQATELLWRVKGWSD